MMNTTKHREEVKAMLRMRYGSIEAFQNAKELGSQAVRDLLRGKSKTAHEAVAAEFGVDPDHFIITQEVVPVCGHSNTHAAAHRQNAGAK